MSINIKGKTVYGPSIVTDGLVLYLDAANTKSYPGSGTTWYDLKGNDNAVISNVTYSSDNCGNFIFDGSSSYITLNKPLYSLYSFFTFECWVKRNVTNVIHGILSDRQYSFWILGILNANKLRYHHYYYINSTYYDNEVTSLSDILTDWTNIVIVFDINIGVSMYINGILDNSNLNTYPANISDLDINRGPQYIGQYRNGASTGPYYTFDGKIANLKYYSKALSSDEVLKNYNALKSRFI